MDPKVLAGVLFGLLSVTAGLLVPVLASRKLPWRPALPVAKRLAPGTTVFYETTMVAGQVKRKVYPYSIVPGGADDLNQAKRFMADPAIQVHYASIAIAQLRQERLTTNLTGYVSYRWGEKIYWTAKQITLRAGEAVFTDGTHIVRARCLNSYSAVPMQPIRPHEPSEKVLDMPTEMPMTVYSFPRLPVLAPELPVPPGELTPTVPVLPVVLAPPAGKTPGGIWFPLIPIIPPIHRHPGSPPSGPLPPPPVIPPVAVIPEPRYGWLLIAGFAAIIAIRLRRPWPHFPSANR